MFFFGGGHKTYNHAKLCCEGITKVQKDLENKGYSSSNINNFLTLTHFIFFYEATFFHAFFTSLVKKLAAKRRGIEPGTLGGSTALLKKTLCGKRNNIATECFKKKK